ncbi:MAG: hypothetical protein LBH46_01160 [Rickettsiales bacterium]|jgi:oligoribonuclease NrnB/cAMP/cGMP phosphodiesterase (DHH superfamily)|nr:hypothetical protein [Rickettsiales bacterium]
MVSKNILFTHIDLDGAGCALLFKTFMQFEEVFYINHGLDNKVDKDIIKILSKRQDLKQVNVFISDISPSLDETYKWLIKNCNTLKILDHHKTQEEFALKYAKNFIYSPAMCGTMLVKGYLQEAELYNELSNKFIKDWDYLTELINDNDLWLNEHVFSKDLDKLFSFLGLTRFVEIFTDRPFMLYRYNDIIDILKEMEERYVEKAIQDKQQCFYGDYVYAERYKNEICNQLAEVNESGIGIAISMRSKNISLRSREDVDVSKIAIANGGGGHKNAAGFLFDTLQELDSFLKTGQK